MKVNRITDDYAWMECFDPSGCRNTVKFTVAGKPGVCPACGAAYRLNRLDEATRFGSALVDSPGHGVFDYRPELGDRIVECHQLKGEPT